MWESLNYSWTWCFFVLFCGGFHRTWPHFYLTGLFWHQTYNVPLWWRRWWHHIKTLFPHKQDSSEWAALYFTQMCLCLTTSPLWALESLFVEEMSTAEVESSGAADKPSASSCAALPPGPMKGILIGQGMSVSWNNECWISSMAASLFSLAGRLSPEDLCNQKKLARFVSEW